jgi:DNA (cytosine-5)-methyltransferase 1
VTFPARLEQRPRQVSLCTGYGGLDMAVAALTGAEPALVADNDPGAGQILAHRYPGVPNIGDIAAADWAAWAAVLAGRRVHVVAGFPCQDVSCAGARAGLRAGTRSGTWSQIARAVGVLRPELVFLENVASGGGLLSAWADSNVEWCPWCMGTAGDRESVLRACGAVLGDLADLGYDTVWRVVSAASVGAPHLRKRVFILGWQAAADPGGRGVQ